MASTAVRKPEDRSNLWPCSERMRFRSAQATAYGGLLARPHGNDFDRRRRVAVLAVAATVVSALAPTNVHGTDVRVKDLARVYGTEGHKLIGYGLVVGLEGTGDSNKVLFTARSLANMLENFGITVPAETLRADNVAAVMVTAELPAEVQVGTRVDVLVSSLGDADSLQGGTLLMTPLRGADGEVYAVAQGPVSIGGFNASAGASKVQKNHPVVGRVPNGGSVLRPVSSPVLKSQRLSILLHQPDFTTALRIAEAINASLGEPAAKAMNQAAIEVLVPERWRQDVVSFVALIESIRVRPDIPARVVVNERTGTVVISGNVRILPVAIAHGGLTVEVQTHWEVSQPPPFIQAEYSRVTNVQAQAQSAIQSETSAASGSRKDNLGESGEETSGPPQKTGVQGTVETQSAREQNNRGKGQTAGSSVSQPGTTSTPGLEPAHRQLGGAQPGANRAALRAGLESTNARTVVVPRTEIQAKEAQGRVLAVPEQASLQDLVRALNALGVTPRDLIAVIQALKELGALEGELIMQ